MISRASLRFASCYVYSPVGMCEVSRRSRLLRELLKSANRHYLERFAERVRVEREERPEFGEFFGPDALLIPVPGSARTDAGKPTVAERLARQMIQKGLAAAVWPGLKRVRAVPKSATATAGDRPGVGLHYESRSSPRISALRGSCCSTTS